MPACLPVCLPVNNKVNALRGAEYIHTRTLYLHKLHFLLFNAMHTQQLLLVTPDLGKSIRPLLFFIFTQILETETENMTTICRTCTFMLTKAEIIIKPKQ